jgi:hypothetical protein
MKFLKWIIQKNIYKKLLPIAILLLTTTNTFAQKIVRYDLYVKDTLVNFAGKEKRAIAVNGQIPMPTLDFYRRRHSRNSRS